MEQDLYHLCDGTLLNLQIIKMNKIYNQLSEKKLNTDLKNNLDTNSEQLNFKILIDFLIHFLWWNIEWDSILSKQIKFKSEFIKD